MPRLTAMEPTLPPATLRRIRLWLGLFMAGLVLSGLTAFPLLHELRLLHWLDEAARPWGAWVPPDLRSWVDRVHHGLEHMYAAELWIAYGTDWLAFAHLVLAVFFIGPWQDPVRNRWCVQAGLVACAGVLPLALICGPLRGIPFYWRLIDCSFGVLGAVPLWMVLRLTPRCAR